MITTTGMKGSVQVDGLKIAYESAGAGDRPVVFVHGIFGNRGYYASQVAHLAGRHRVLSIDLRGHGDSEVASSVSVEAFARDVIGVLEAAGTGPAVLCGHSIMGAVALDIADRRPELVRGVVMLDGVIFFPDMVRRGAAEGLLPALQGEQWQGALAGYFGRLIEPAPADVSARVLGDVSRARREIASSFFDNVFGSGFTAREERNAEALARLHCPLMYVRAASPTDLHRLQACKPDVMLGQVVGSGHWLMLSAADQVNAMLDRFLSDLDQRP